MAENARMLLGEHMYSRMICQGDRIAGRVASGTWVRAYRRGMGEERIEAGLPWAPARCTLPTAKRPLRVAEFDALFAEALRDLRRTGPTGLRLTLDCTDEVAARVADLVERESGCCSFFTFTVGRDHDRLLLDVEVPATHVDVLDALHARAAMVAVVTWAAGTPGTPGASGTPA